MAPAAGEAMSTASSGELEAASGEHRLAAARGFAESYGRAPEAVWSAPGRVNPTMNVSELTSVISASQLSRRLNGRGHWFKSSTAH
jgi:hypothetical protein